MSRLSPFVRCLAALFAGFATLLAPSGLDAAAEDELSGWGARRTPQEEVGLVKAVATFDQIVVVQSDGSLAAWGGNIAGQAAPPSGTDYRSVFAGPDYSYAIKQDGTAVAWGEWAYDSLTPPAGTYQQITGGSSSIYGLRTDGTIVRWGPAIGPVFNPPAGNTFIAISGNDSHFLALRADGTIAGWGNNVYGQATAPAGNDFKAVVAATHFSLALRNDGSIHAWGEDFFGQISGAPTDAGYRAIAAGATHGLALRLDGSLVVWGAAGDPVITAVPSGNDFVAIGAGGFDNFALRADGTFVVWGTTTTGSPPPFTGYAALAAGDDHSLGLRADGSLVGWGRNDYGQATPPAGNNFVAVAVGALHSLALRADGTLVAWGNNEQGQANEPTTDGFAKIAAAGSYCVALKTDGTIVAWGANNNGQATPPAGNNFTAIAAGPTHALALTTDGTIVGWGYNGSGQATPPSGTGYTAIAAGEEHSVALRADGSIAAWGHNASGQTSAPSGTGYIAIAAGDVFNLALTANGIITAWGEETDANGAMRPPGGTGYTFISAASNGQQALALRTPGAPPPPPMPLITWPAPGVSYLPTEDVMIALAGDPSEVSEVKLFLHWNQPGSGAARSAEWAAKPGTHWSTADTAVRFTTIDWDALVDDHGAFIYQLRARAYKHDGSFTDGNAVTRQYAETTYRCLLDMLFDNVVGTSIPLVTGAPPASAAIRKQPATLAAAAVLDLDLYRRFRDEVLADSPAGRFFTDLYEENSLAFMQAIFADPELVLDVHQALVDWTPFVTAVVDGQGGTAQISPDMAAQAQVLLARVRVAAPPALATAMADEINALDVATWNGLTGTQLLGRIEAQTRPAPEIASQPAPQSVTAGTGVTLTVAAGEDTAGPVTYQWYRNGVAIPGATSATYAVPSAQNFHAGDYTVTVTNPFGATPSSTAAFAVNAPAPNNARLLNLSTRAQALTGSDILIPGFVVSGTANKRLLIRAVGPTLAGYGVPGTLDNPRLALKRLDFSTPQPTYVDIAANDDWQTNANAAAITQTAADLFAFPFADDREAALLVDLAPGQYTVFADGVADATGIAIVELYDADSAAVNARLINISNRGFVGTGAQVMIPGFVVSSEGPKTLLIRVVGPTLAPPPYNVPGTMADPRLQLFRKETNGTDTLLLEQDNWGDNPDAAFTASTAQAVSAFALANGSADAAFVVTLPPGVYTVVGSAADGTSTGVVLVEVYVVP